MSLAKFLPLLLTITLLSACEAEVGVKVDDVANHLVVNSVFSSDDLLRVHISETRDVFSDTVFKKPQPVRISVFEDEVFKELLSTTDDQVYSSVALKPAPNHLYKLVVESSYGQFVSQSSLPTVTPVDSLSVTRNFGKSNVGNAYHKLNMHFTDNPLDTNYYAVSLSFEYLEEVWPFGFEVGKSGLFSYDPILNQEISYSGSGFPPQEIIFSDQLINGKPCSIDIFFYNFMTNHDPYAFQLVVNFYTLSKEYFRYLKTLELYHRQRSMSFWEDIVEPISVYSNISNGYGIFGGYSKQVDTLIIGR